MTDTPQERRRFKRIPFDARTELRQGEQRWPVNLLDLSLKGLLIEKPAPWQDDAEAPFSADIHLGDDALVSMELRLAHDEERQLGFKCEHIDLDSITHLRRVIELNLGDPQALERELGELTSQ
jgi:hypothetical protein